MRIAYLGQMADVASENGISKKIRMQAAGWITAGHAVRYFALTPTAEIWAGLAPLETDIMVRGTGLVRSVHSRALCQRIRVWRPDVIYFRYAHHSPGLRRLFREVPAVAEINSDDTTEYVLTLSWLKRLYHRLTRERILREVQAFVPVTRDLAARFAGFAKPAEVIGNSIDCAALTPLAPPAAAARPHLVFVGNTGTPWHGLDRLGELARLLPDFDFVVIGCTAADYHACVPAGQPPGNMQCLGMLSQQDYLPLLREATAAVGTLGLYRKQMNEACPLKVREYLALGLPVIGAYRDTDIPEDADYFLRLPNDAAPLAPLRERIAAFFDHWRGRRVPRSAIAHLDVSVKEAQRLAFMEKIVSEYNPRHA